MTKFSQKNLVKPFGSLLSPIFVLYLSAHLVNFALTGILSKLQPSLMQPLLRRLVFDVLHLTENNKLALKVM